eukprot:403333453
MQSLDINSITQLNSFSSNIRIKFTSHKIRRGVVFYDIAMIDDDTNKEFLFSERFSKLHDFHLYLKKYLKMERKAARRPSLTSSIYKQNASDDKHLINLPSFPSKISLFNRLSNSKILKRQRKLENYFNQLVRIGDENLISFIQNFAIHEDHSGQRKISMDFYSQSFVLNSDCKVDETRDDSFQELDLPPFEIIKMDKPQKQNRRFLQQQLEIEPKYVQESFSLAKKTGIRQINQNQLPGYEQGKSLAENCENFQQKQNTYSYISEQKESSLMSRLLSETFIQQCNLIVEETNEEFIKIGLDQEDYNFEELQHENSSDLLEQPSQSQILRKELQTKKFLFDQTLSQIPNGQENNLQAITQCIQFIDDKQAHQELIDIEQVLGIQLEQIQQIMRQTDLLVFMKDQDLVQNFCNPLEGKSSGSTSISQLIGLTGMYS